MTAAVNPLPHREPAVQTGPGRLNIIVATSEAWPIVRDWANANHWSPGKHDGPCYRAADPGSLHIGYLGPDWAPVSSVFAANHDDRFAFLGGYMVTPNHRGRGHGRATFDAGMDHAAGRTVGLHAVTDQVQNYRNAGFTPAHSVWRYSGTITARPEVLSRSSDLVYVAEVGLDALAEYDARHFPALRPAFLKAWATAPGHIARVAVDGSGITGYGVIRPTTDHTRIGPLIARDADTARALLVCLIAESGAADIAMDVPDPNPDGVALAAEMGLHRVFEMVTMFTPGPLRHVDHAAVFAVASAELG